MKQFPEISNRTVMAYGVAFGHLRHVNPGCIPTCVWSVMEGCWHHNPEDRVSPCVLLQQLMAIRKAAVEEILQAKEARVATC